MADIATLNGVAEDNVAILSGAPDDTADTVNGVTWSHFALSAVHFDGTNDYLTGAPTFPDGTDGTFSMWVLPSTSGNGTTRRLWYNAGGYISSTFNTSNIFRMIVHNSAATELCDMQSTASYSDGAWHHIMCSWVTGTSSHMYIDNVDVKSLNNESSGTIDYTRNWAFGARETGLEKWYGDVSQFWMHDTYIDLSSSGNRLKFYNDGPVDLGATGTNPTGGQPRLYFNNPLATWQTNLGSGGGFTEIGTLTAASSSPTD